MVNGRLALHDVDDASALCAGIIGRSNLHLSWHDCEELHAYLVEECWQLSLRYRPGTNSTASFAGWATTTLRLRVVDWQREHFGRTRWQFKDRTVEYERPQFVSLDADDSERDRLGASLAGGGLDDGSSRLADQLRSAEARGCRPGRRDDSLGGEAAL